MFEHEEQRIVFDVFHRIVSGMSINIYWDGRNVKTVSEGNI